MMMMRKNITEKNTGEIQRVITENETEIYRDVLDKVIEESPNEKTHLRWRKVQKVRMTTRNK